MGTRGDTYPLVFLLLILFPSPPPGSTQTSTDVKCLGPSRAACRSHVRCISLAGSYYCNCIDGYESSSGEATFSGASDNTCHDIDECLGPSRADCGPHAHCTNMPGSYSCSCIDGYESSSGKATFRRASENTCRDIDECLGPSRADCGPHAHCTNTPGSYYCSCIDGYESSSGKATFRSASENTCLDVKCLGPSRADCRPHVRCISLAGSYYCNCIDGYESSSGEATFSRASDNTCHDIDECLGPRRADCGPHANCTNMPGSYYCSCIDGYESSSGKATFRSASENTCLDVKCLGPSRAACRPHVRCISLAGSYYCNCIDGYESSSGEKTFSGASDNTCHDIDECLGPSRADCGPHAHCTNMPGSYSCSCIDGYESSSGKATFRSASENTCLDIDECLGPSRADCGPHAHCTNMPGSYYCSCIDGYESSSGKATFRSASENTCRDVKCLGPSRADCRPHVRCVNLAGSYYCNCIDGYESSSGEATFSGASDNTCHDIDECLGPSRADCGPHAHCTNMPGSYSCSCIDGYESSSGKATFRSASENTCRDVKCLGPSRADCRPHVRCINLAGSYYCNCIDGYESSSGEATFSRASDNTCHDIDECLGPRRADCGPHANCTNMPGSYYCSCINGYESNSGKATFRRASENTCLDVKCLGPSRAACRPHVRCISLAGSYYCNCIDGYESSSGEKTFSGASDNTCHDIDECLGPSRADCGPHAHCTNMPGSYSCSCIDGYESSSGKATFRSASENTCLDIDECLGPSRADCGPHAHCTNMPGSYYCSCIDGYESSSGKATFRSASENTCRDVKCLGPSRADCRPHVRCVNLAGSYYCNCIDGYESSSGEATFSGASDNTCHDIDECLGPSRADCGPHAHCTNMPGSYSCSCIDGYESSSGKATFRSASENTCRDVKCLGPSRADCRPHVRCINLAGSYYCNCIDGYESSSGEATFSRASDNTCHDIDECLGPRRADCGPHANCTNMPGSYYCSCIDGYESSSGKATFRRASENTCRDINECARSSDICGPGALCSNTGGSFQCRCPADLIPSTGVGSWVLNQTTCEDPCYNSSAELERIKDRRRNCSVQGELSSSSSSFCSFLNSTLEILTSTCGARSVALSLEEEIHIFSALMNNTSVWDSMSEGEVASAVDVLLQSVEEAVLATARRSPERMTQSVTTESMAVQTRLVTGACSQDSEIFRLSAHGETMDVHCDTVTGAATQGLTAAAVFISYSTLGSIINRTLLSQGNPPAGGTLGNSHLNSRVVSGAVGGRRHIHLSRPANFTLRHSQDIQAKEESLCVYWKFVDGEGTWSRDGCTVLHANSTHTTCSCDHLSSFALLMAPTAVTVSRC